MSDREEWGPWVQHDGKGCPCFGMMVKVALFDGTVLVCRVGSVRTREELNTSPFSGWVWHIPEPARVRAYRIRRPRALQQLREMIETLPAPEREDA
ncbi:hypothetical protein ACTJI6_02695 [Paracoccus sp. 22332]